MKVAELAKRVGLRASDVDGYVSFVDENKDPEGKGYYEISFVDSFSPEIAEDLDRFFDLLGVKERWKPIKGFALHDLEDRLDHALSLAPRARTI